MWVETAANSLFGIFVDADPDQDNQKDMGHLMQRLKQSILEFLEDIWHLHLDVRILLGLVEKLEDNSTQRLRIIKL